jgi:RNA polymerase sigma factor (sigma-70 family)
LRELSDAYDTISSAPAKGGGSYFAVFSTRSSNTNTESPAKSLLGIPANTTTDKNVEPFAALMHQLGMGANESPLAKALGIRTDTNVPAQRLNAFAGNTSTQTPELRLTIQTAAATVARATEGRFSDSSNGLVGPVHHVSAREGTLFPENLPPTNSLRARSDSDGDVSASPRQDLEQPHNELPLEQPQASPEFLGSRRVPNQWAHFDEFYQSMYPRLLRLGVALVWSKAVAEDHVQDAFAKTYARFATLDEPEAYVRKTLVNEIRVSLRRREMMQRFAPLLRSASTHTDRYTDDSLLKALDSLPLRQRAALILRYYEQCSEQEIAHALNCRPGTVKSLLSRGLASLRKVVDHE